MLGVPAAQPSAASVGARLGMGEDIVQKLIAEIKGCCSWVVRFFFEKAQIFQSVRPPTAPASGTKQSCEGTLNSKVP